MGRKVHFLELSYDELKDALAYMASSEATLKRTLRYYSLLTLEELQEKALAMYGGELYVQEAVKVTPLEMKRRALDIEKIKPLKRPEHVPDVTVQRAVNDPEHDLVTALFKKSWVIQATKLAPGVIGVITAKENRRKVENMKRFYKYEGSVVYG